MIYEGKHIREIPASDVSRDALVRELGRVVCQRNRYRAALVQIREKISLRAWDITAPERESLDIAVAALRGEAQKQTRMLWQKWSGRLGWVLIGAIPAALLLWIIPILVKAYQTGSILR